MPSIVADRRTDIHMIIFYSVVMRPTFTKITRILAMTTGTLAVVQFALAGYGAFSAFSHHHGYSPHEILGSIIGGFTLLTMIAAIGQRNPRVLSTAITLFVLAGPVQPLLASVGKHHAWVGALHALVGVAILGACFALAMRTRPVSTTSTPEPAA
jgi:Family of unknown function (DUF6220)